MSQNNVTYQSMVVSLDKGKDYHTINLSSDKNTSLGNLFILGKVKTSSSELKKIIDSLVDFIYEKYLEHAHPNAEECLEEIFQVSNQEWQRLIAESKISLDDPQIKNFFLELNLVIGILKDTSVHFAHVGGANAFLIRKNNAVNILESMEIEENFNFLKLFSNVISGKLKNDDALLFSFNDFTDFFSIEKIKRIVIDCTPKKAVDYFKELIMPLEIKKTFCFAIFKVNEKKYLETKEEIQKKSFESNKITKINVEQKNDSMKELVLKQQKTQDFIQPKLTPQIGKKIGNKILKILKKSFEPVKNGTKSISGKLTEINKKVKENKSIEIKFSDNKKNIERGITKKQTSIYLPKHNKLYLIVSLVLVVLIAGIIAYSINHQKGKEIQENYQKIISQIEEKQNLVSAAMLYGDNNRAQEILAEIQDLIFQIPDNEEFQERHAELSQKNQEKLDELLKLYKASPKKIADLTYDANNLISTSNNLYAWQKNYFIKVGLEENRVEKMAELNENYGDIKLATALSENSILVYTSSNNFVRFDPNQNSFFDFEVKTESLSNNPKSMAVYGGRLYILDPSNNQIFRYQNKDDNFVDENGWLGESIDIKDLESIAIDGNIWSVNSTGKVYKFFTGKQENFSSNIKPEVKNISKLYTRIDWLNLYLLDSEADRIIILNKINGEVLKQFYASDLNDIKDFIIDESSKTIYVLNDKTIYSFNF